jgi:hypothetical protein
VSRRPLADLVVDLVDADQALAELGRREHAAGVERETPAYLEANNRVHTARRAIPWWARWWADHRSLRLIDVGPGCQTADETTNPTEDQR